VEELTAEEFDAANHVNLTGTFCLAREAAAVMKTGGSIVVYSSMYGLVAPDPDMYPPPRKPNPIEYGMGKAAIVQMVKYLASYWGHRGIRVNGIAPGAFPHPRGDGADPDFVQLLVNKVPMGRIGRREETAGAVVFLASDDASYITGQTLAVDGGWTAR
jgi:NAD(P)-dependent dehydrogenase (short-subunit alcohol dehydrogenase family)